MKKMLNKLYRLFIRPNGVTWQTPKDTLADAVKVAVFTVITAVILIAADFAFGKILEIILM